MSNQRPRPSPMLIAGALLLAFSATCVVSYWRIGSYVDADGFLHEPFGLIPLGYLSGFLGAILLVVGFVRRR